MTRFLTALGEAEDHLTRDPAGARRIVQQRLGYDDPTMDTLWPEHQFSLSYDQSLLTAMNDEGRWMIRNGMTSATALPDLRGRIDASALLAVKPEAVNRR